MITSVWGNFFLEFLGLGFIMSIIFPLTEKKLKFLILELEFLFEFEKITIRIKVLRYLRLEEKI